MLIDGLGIGVPYKTFRGAGETLNQSSLYLPLKSTIVPSKGTSTPTFTRATAAWSFDNEGKLNLNVPSGCVRFKGGRLVRNRAPASEDMQNVGWNKSNVSASSTTEIVEDGTSGVHQLAVSITTFGDLLLRADVKRGSGTTRHIRLEISGTDGGKANFNVDTGDVTSTANFASGVLLGSGSAPSSAGYRTFWILVRIPTSQGLNFYVPRFLSGLDGGISYTGDATSSFHITNVQIENVSGQADQTASEYVSVGVLSSPYHGAGADGCKWFPTNKDGSAIPSSTLEGYFAEPSRTNNCLWNRDLTNVAWTNTNITASKTATGLDNVSNSATRLTAAAADATITQLLTAATGTRTLSAYIKRVSGTGTISLTRNGGTGWTDITSSLVTGSWVLVKMTSDVGANPTVGIKMGTSGDVIDVDCVQDENGAWATSPILTTTAAVTRNADVLSYASAFDVAQGTALCSLRSDIPVNSGSIIYALQGGTGGSASFVYTNSADARTISRAYDGANVAAVTSADITTGIRKKAVRWGTDLVCAGDGILGTVKPFDGSMGVSSTLFVGCNSISTEPLSGTIRDVHIWPTPLTDTQMKQVTT